MTTNPPINLLLGESNLVADETWRKIAAAVEAVAEQLKEKIGAQDEIWAEVRVLDQNVFSNYMQFGEKQDVCGGSIDMARYLRLVTTCKEKDKPQSDDIQTEFSGDLKVVANYLNGKLIRVIDEMRKELLEKLECVLNINDHQEEEEQTNISTTLEVSSERDECEHPRRQRIGERLEFLPDKKVRKGEKEAEVIYEGNYKVPVAVIRLPKTDYNIDSDKINLLAAKSHSLPNIVRYYGIECDQECYYLAMEPCWDAKTFNLDQFICGGCAYEEYGLGSTYVVAVPNEGLESVKSNVGDFKLIPEHGGPIPELSYTLLRKVLCALLQLHKSGIRHGNLRPENILIFRKGSSSWCVKLCDIEITKQLPPKIHNRSSSYLGLFGVAAGRGTSDRQDRNVGENQIWEDDMRDFGKIFFYCITGTSLFDDWETVNKNPLENYPEADHLYSCLSTKNPAESLRENEVLGHPHFWDPVKKLEFLWKASHKSRDHLDKNLSNELKKIGRNVFVGKWNDQNVKTWDKRIDGDIINYATRELRKLKPDSTYKYDSLSELLRFIRNMYIHFDKHPPNIKKFMGSKHKSFYCYFESRFPNLLIEVYKAVKKCCGKEEYFGTYFLHRC